VNLLRRLLEEAPCSILENTYPLLLPHLKRINVDCDVKDGANRRPTTTFSSLLGVVGT
jgi:hypothetical protein